MPRSTQNLHNLFNPQKIALVGAKDDAGSVAGTILKNLSIPNASFDLYLVNPKRESIGEKRCYPSLLELPEEMDLVIIVTPAPTVPKIIEDCVKTNAKSIIVISAGFKEVGEEGKKREEAIHKLIKGTSIRLIGPNCLGVMNTHCNLNATFAADMAIKGKVAFVSQSGAMCTAALDWSLEKEVGFSSLVSIGSMMDVDFATLLDYFAEDPNTETVVLYVESIGDAPAFLKAARRLSQKKPVVMIKGGKTQAAAKACLSHTGSMAGSDDILELALQSVGILRVYTMHELFNLLLLLSKQPLLRGPNISIITNAGGPGIVATDSVVLNGLSMTSISSETIKELDKVLPSSWSKGNPIDVLGDAKADAYSHAIAAADKDPNTDGILVILTPQDMTEPSKTAEDLTKSSLSKPTVASWIGGVKVNDSKEIFAKSSIPNFSYPDEAIRALGLEWRLVKTLNTSSKSTAISSRHPKASQVEEELKKIRETGREVLTEIEAKRIIGLYDIPTITMRLAATKEEAIHHANEIGYPIVLKIFSETITHKTDIGGVKLNLKNESEVKAAFREIQSNVEKAVGLSHFQGVSVQPMIKMDGYEIIIGSTSDAQFGPVILFGSGGAYVEVYKDTALTLPPLSKESAHSLIEKTKIYKLLKGFRGKAGVDIEKVAEILISFSQLLMDHPIIKECDINPLKISSEGMVALDARIVLYPKTTSADQIPKPCLLE